MNSRSKELCGAVDTFMAAHAKWQNSQHRELIDDPWLDALETLFDTFQHGGIPDDCEQLEDAVGALSTAFSADEAMDFLAKPDRMERTWVAMRTLVKRRKEIEPKERKPIESMKDLAAQGVSHEQIARMHGLVDADGHGKSWLVSKELTTPGSVMGSDGFPKPEFNSNNKPITEEEEVKRRRRRFTSRRTDKPAEAKPCPETPRELWQQQVSIAQSATMLCKSEDEVRELFAGFDEEFAGSQSDDAKTAKVIELAAAGLDPKVIAKKVELDRRAVEAIIKHGKPVEAS
jgi:hypothetical protein